MRTSLLTTTSFSLSFFAISRQAKISYCIGGFWACGLCYFVPDWMRIGYDYQHQCPCGFTVALVRHDQPVENADYVPSRYAADA